MKKYFILIFKNILLQLVSLLIVAGFIALASLTFPTTPSGEVIGGNFMNYFNKILVNTGSSTDGKVKNADKLDGYNHTDFIKTEIDPTIGVLTSGKWCKYNGTKITCIDNAPSAVSGDIIAGCLGSGPYDSGGATGSPSCWGGAIQGLIFETYYDRGQCPTGSTIRYIGSTSGPLGGVGFTFLCIKN